MASFVKLAAFDFDHTIINPNSDTYIDKILLTNATEKYYKYPERVEMDKEWTARMNAVFEYMFSVHKIDGMKILECLKEIKIDDCMVEFIRALKENDYELIILSDANSLFIETILKQNNLANVFDKVFTNEAAIGGDGRLVVKPLNETYNPNGEPFRCSTGFCKNICKGNILNDYLAKNVNGVGLKHMLFVGDGKNDYCGGLRLHEKHHFCVRKDFILEKLLRDAENRSKIKANVVYWRTANDIIKQFKEQKIIF